MRGSIGCARILSAAVLLSLGAAEALRLFNSGVCPFAQRAWIALLETRAPFDHVIIDLANKPAEFLAVSPTPHAAKVPLLELDDGTVVVESVDVARRIATDVGDRRLLPTGTERHVDAFVELWTGWVEPAYYAVLTAQSEAQVQSAAAGLLDALGAVESALSEREDADGSADSFLLGSTFSLAEAIAGPWVERMIRMLPHWRDMHILSLCEARGLQRTRRWLEAVAARPSVAETSAGTAEMIRASRLYYVDYVSPGAPGEL